MVVPLSYFIEKPFQNWTRTGGELIGSVFFYVDHTAPVDAIRKKPTEIASQSKLWNGKVVSLQVSDCKETTIELRALVSANSASAGLGFALRGARKTHRFPPAQISRRVAASALRNH